MARVGPQRQGGGDVNDTHFCVQINKTVVITLKILGAPVKIISRTGLCSPVLRYTTLRLSFHQMAYSPITTMLFKNIRE